MHSDVFQSLPHNVELEQAILGAILIDPAALSRAQEYLAPSDFYKSSNQRIYAIMNEQAATGTAPDYLTIVHASEEKGHFNASFTHADLAEMLTVVASSSNIERHCKQVLKLSIARRLIKELTDVTRRAYAGDAVEDLIEGLMRRLGDLISGRDRDTWCSMETIAHEVIDHVEQASKGSAKRLFIPTGHRELDACLGGGYHRSDLVIIAARPSMGKTSLALGSAMAAAKHGACVGIVSLEMSRQQLGIRLLSMDASINVHALRSGKVGHEGWWTLANSAQQMAPLPLWVCDSAVLTVERLVNLARQLHMKHGPLDVLIVDYLQLLQLQDAETRQQGIADASRQLKLLAKELNIAVLVLSQLSRDCEKRTDKRPVLADLRDSGAIEQDADVVLFIYRHQVYFPDTDEKGVAEVLMRKHRNGPIGDILLKFVDSCARFEDVNE